MKNVMIFCIFACCIAASCSKHPQIVKVVPGKLVRVIGNDVFCQLKLEVDTSMKGGLGIVATSYNVFDHDAKKDDSMRVALYSDGSIEAHTYRMRTDIMIREDRGD